MKNLPAYRVLTGSQYSPGDDTFIATVFHMTFYASDKDVLSYLMIISNCPNGRIYPSEQVHSADPFQGPTPIPSAN